MNDAAPAARPASPAELFLACTRLALQGFGGVLPVAQRELVERLRWLTREQFLEQLSVAQVLPGPNIVNLVLIIGDRLFGWRGAVAATAGILLAPLVLVLSLAVLVGQLQGLPFVAGALRGMGVVSAGLVLSTACKLAPALRRNPLGPLAGGVVAALTVAAIAALRWPLAAVVLGLGTVSVLLAGWRLSR
ncbi:Chromate transporter [Rubrivivax sp. A210]|uniref:chromate transporter n=1 Tax=Rubrivivax sp. A210 TaxID=2772301 RepID=UPI00191B1904|nr:chromate transporter [Rubrivivax sp. A210]CAD5374898.1 Chromate transporter [Rubrivivax sp. A210]